MKNKMVDLRNHLFVALERLADDDGGSPEEIARARAVSDVAQTLINSARAEIEMCKLMRSAPVSDFISVLPVAPLVAHESAN